MIPTFRIWFLQEEYDYLGQCDYLRRKGFEEEWQEMMSRKRPISRSEFEALCNLDRLLDDGEGLDDFIASDPDSKFYRSLWGNRPCCFVQTAGFEFIFI
jgi:hypothetical protein